MGTGLLEMRVRIPPEAWMYFKYCVLSGRRLGDGLITRPEESAECDFSDGHREALVMRWP